MTKLHPNAANLLGKRFTRWIVHEAVNLRDANGASKLRWKCQCDCGAERLVGSAQLLNGESKSCGCYNRDRAADALRTHGKTKTRVHRAWAAMKRRCLNSNATQYKHYGGRGITICERWLTFENFYSDMGDPPEGMTLDRIDTNGPYSAKNCRWADQKTQHRNRRCVKLNVEKVVSIKRALKAGVRAADLAREHGVSWEVIGQIKSGKNWKDVAA